MTASGIKTVGRTAPASVFVAIRREIMDSSSAQLYIRSRVGGSTRSTVDDGLGIGDHVDVLDACVRGAAGVVVGEDLAGSPVDRAREAREFADLGIRSPLKEHEESTAGVALIERRVHLTKDLLGDPRGRAGLPCGPMKQGLLLDPAAYVVDRGVGALDGVEMLQDPHRVRERLAALVYPSGTGPLLTPPHSSSRWARLVVALISSVPNDAGGGELGLFGDKKLKQLNHQLESGWLALGLGMKMGRGSQTVDNIGAAVFSAARALAADGRAAEAQSRISASKKLGDGEVEAMWNALLTNVENRLSPQ